MAQAAFRVKLLHQFVERHLLMLISIESHVPHPAHQLFKSRVAGKVQPQGQIVRKQADQAFEFFARAPRNRAAHHNVFLPAIFRKQRLKRRQQRHVQAHAVPLRQRLQARRQLARKRERQLSAARCLHRRPRPVRRKFQQGHAIQLLLPVIQQPLIALAFQRAVLPHRVIGILQWRFCQRRSFAFPKRRVKCFELPRENGPRGTIEQNVMQRQQKKVIFRGQL